MKKPKEKTPSSPCLGEGIMFGPSLKPFSHAHFSPFKNSDEKNTGLIWQSRRNHLYLHPLINYLMAKKQAPPHHVLYKNPQHRIQAAA